MHILTGKLKAYFVLSHLLKLLAFISLLYLKLFPAAIALFLAGFFLRATVPQKADPRKNDVLTYLNRLCLYVLLIWFLHSTSSRIVSDLADFFLAVRLKAGFIVLACAYFISAYLLDKNNIGNMSDAEILSYYED